MAKSTSSLATPLRDQLDRLAAFQPVEDPVLSLYLDMRPNQNGRDQYGAFLRKRFRERAATFTGEKRKSFDQDVERINAYLEQDLKRSANGLAIFACHAQGLFEAVQLDVPMEDHWLFISAVPHLYPLVRLNDQYPRYAALVVNTNEARLYVFSLGAAQSESRVENTKTRRSMMGGWSQARYQRHVENFHLHHMKEVVDLLDRVVRDELIEHIVIACDDTTRPTLYEQLPQHLGDKIVDTVHLGVGTAVHDVLQETLEVMRQKDAESDIERVGRLLDAWRGGGLAVAGPEDTLRALERAQVEELLISGATGGLRLTRELPADAAPGPVEVETSSTAQTHPDQMKLADELVTRAQQQSARIRIIEDPALLESVGGVGALLRFRI